MVDVRIRFIERTLPENRRGFAEKIVRRALEKRGCEVWRGGYLHAPERTSYPNVLNKYARCLELLTEQGYDVYALIRLCKRHKGMPDFLVYDKTTFYFVEAKLEHEQLSRTQRWCIEELSRLGICVEVHKVCAQAKGREWILNVVTGEKVVCEEQKRLKKRY